MTKVQYIIFSVQIGKAQSCTSHLCIKLERKTNKNKYNVKTASFLAFNSAHEGGFSFSRTHLFSSISTSCSAPAGTECDTGSLCR